MLRVGDALVAGVTLGGEVGEQRVGCHDGGLHHHVGALYLGHVQETRGVADQHATRKGELGHRLEAAFVQRAGAVGDAPAAFENLADFRVGLEALKFFVGRQVGVAVIEADHKPHRHLVVFEVVQEGAAVNIAGNRPADGVHREA